MTDVLYVARGASQTTSDLYVVATATGVCTSVGATGVALTGLAFDPTDDGSLYGVTSNNSSVHPHSLVSIDRATAATTFIASLASNAADIAFDSTGQLYGIFPGSPTHLEKIDKVTGAVTDVGSVGYNSGCGNGVAIDSADNGSLGSSTTLYDLDITTGAAVALGSVTGIVGGGCPNAASFDSSDTLWWQITANIGTSRIYTVDPNALTVTVVAVLDVTFIDAMAWYIPATPPPASRHFQSPFWRFVVLDRDTFETLSFLDQFATSRTATFTLNQPAVATGKVPSDNPEVNIPWPTVDDDPFVAEGVRVLYGFRREGTLADPPVWVARFAGMVMQIEDTAETDTAYSHFTAYDPWQYLLSRPVCNADGSLPGPNGISFTAADANTIALELLLNTITNQGDVGIDAGVAWGGTGFYTGTIETCDAIDINFPQGTSVGQAWQTLTQMNVCDIVLDPIYDPTNRPRYLVQFNIYAQAGSPQDSAIFAWDRPSRSLVGLSRLIEGGTQRANVVKFFAGQGGSATGGQTIATQTDAASIAKFGEYWRQQFFPNQTVAAAVLALAQAQLELSQAGRVTVALTPAPERSPQPLLEYNLGDRVPVYASDRFRAPIPPADVSSSDTQNYQRIYGIPIEIGDDSIERVRQLLTAIPE